jgi:hypothetical protein
MINWKIKYLRLRIKSKDYYSDRLNNLLAHKEMLDKRFRIFENGGIVGDRIWDLEGGAYLDYCRRVKPILNKRIAWYKKKQVEELPKSL